MAAHQASLSLGFSRQEHWSGLPFPSPMHESEKWKWSHSVMSNSVRPQRWQPTRLLHPWDFLGKSAGVGCHCLLRFSSYLQCFPVSGSFPVSQFVSGGPSIWVSVLASVLPMNIQDWFPLELSGFISLQSKRLKIFIAVLYTLCEWQRLPNLPKNKTCLHMVDTNEFKTK